MKSKPIVMKHFSTVQRNWTNSLKDFTMNCFQLMIVADVGTVVKCIMEVFQVKIWKEMRKFWI